MGWVGSWVHKFTWQWVGLGWVGSVIWWVGLGWVDENRPTDNSACASRKGFNSVSAFWHSNMSQWISAAISRWERSSDSMWKVVATSAHLPPWRLLSRQCSDQLLVTVPFLLLHRGHPNCFILHLLSATTEDQLPVVLAVS